MLKMQGLVQTIAFAVFFGMIPLTQFEIFDPSGTFSQSWSHLFIFILKRLTKPIFAGSVHKSLEKAQR